jgi:hypothetical protein
VCSVGVVTLFLVQSNYSRNKSTKSPASGAGNVSEPRRMSEVGSVHVLCLSVVKMVHVPVFVCLRSTCSHVNDGGP